MTLVWSVEPKLLVHGETEDGTHVCVREWPKRGSMERYVVEVNGERVRYDAANRRRGMTIIVLGGGDIITAHHKLFSTPYDCFNGQPLQ